MFKIVFQSALNPLNHLDEMAQLTVKLFKLLLLTKEIIGDPMIYIPVRISYVGNLNF